jgi:hypothetical protein
VLQKIWRWLVGEVGNVATKEFLKFLVLWLAAIIGGWLLAFINAVFHLEQPVTLDALKNHAVSIIENVAAHPYDYTIGLIRSNPVHSISGLIITGVVLSLLFLLRRANYRIRNLSERIADANVAQSLIAQSGLGGRWPHAKLAEGGAPWKDVCAEILRHDNGILYILGANGVDTFGRPAAPLFEVLPQFRHDTRIILVSPRSKEVEGRARAVGMDPQEYKANIETSVRRLRDLRRQQHPIEGRYYAGQPNWKLIITSRTIWMQYYMPNGQHVDATPCWRFDITSGDDGLYHYFFMEFNRIWRRCEAEQIDLK